MNDRPALARLAGRPLFRMNGVGNAIIVLDLRGSSIVVTEGEARAIANLPGLQFDQLMTVHDAKVPGTDAALRIYNTDGSLSAACGNGTRCVAWVLTRDRRDDHLMLTTEAGSLACHRVGPWDFAVDMGAPSFRWDEIPLAAMGDSGVLDPRALDLGVDDTFGRAFALSMGNPHAVFFIDDADSIDLPRVGPPLEHAAIFPERANISFVQVIDRETLKLRVWERGAGATLACGTGACAALVAAASTGRTGRKATVDLPGGALMVEWRNDAHVLLTGPVALEFEMAFAPEMQEPVA